MAQMFFWLVCMQLVIRLAFVWCGSLGECHERPLEDSFCPRQAVLAITSGALNESGA